jgi:hypothetical protein
LLEVKQLTFHSFHHVLGHNLFIVFSDQIKSLCLLLKSSIYHSQYNWAFTHKHVHQTQVMIIMNLCHNIFSTYDHHLIATNTYFFICFNFTMLHKPPSILKL